MFKYIYIILVIAILITLIILFVNLAILGKDGVIIAEKTQDMQPKLEHIQKKSEELEAVMKSLQEYNLKYGPTIRSFATVLYIYRTYKRNIKKKSSFRAFMKNLKLVTRPNSINSYKTIFNLFK